MKKNQGAKSRKTFTEAERGPSASYADGLVGFFIDKERWYLVKDTSLKAIERLHKPSAVQRNLLPKLREEVKVLGEELASIIVNAPKEHPYFLGNLAKAQAVKNPAYPADCRMLKAYAYFRYIEPIEKMTLQEMETKPVPSPAEVSYQKLFQATQDEKGHPNASQFSRMVKRYDWLTLKRGKRGPDYHK